MFSLRAADLSTSEGARLSVPRVQHTATLLPNGNVLIAGGVNQNGVIGTAEILNPVTMRIEKQIPLQEARYGHTAINLRDGRVLIAGGVGIANLATASAEIFDPVAQTFRRIAPMGEARFRHAAARLPDGSVLVIGGRSGSILRNTCERFDPLTERFLPDASLPEYRFDFTATALADGRIVVVGGTTISFERSIAEEAAPVLIYNPSSHDFARGGDLPLAQHAAALFGDGRVFVYGGTHANPSVIDAAGTVKEVRTGGGVMYRLTATTLRDGSILLAGGFLPSNSDYFRACYVWSAATTNTSAQVDARVARAGHTATLLADGTVLLAGGMTRTGPTDRTEVLAFK
jgi:hypothetical protein